MRKIEKIKKKLKELSSHLEQQYGISNIGIFGSYVKGKENQKSDLDILVEFDSSADLSLLDFIRLENYLSEVLGVKVDLVEKNTLKPRIGKHILKEVVNIK